jgi:parallel beta-helix repeat protein
MTAGTSGSSGPSFTGTYYGISLVDGGVTWRIAGNATGFAVTIETGSTYITFDDCDTTGPYNYSVAVQNSFSGNAPDQIDFTRCTSAGTTAGCFFIGAGRRITLEKNECEAVIGAGTTIAYFIGSSVTGDVTLHNNSAVTNFNYGIYLAHAGTALVTNNKIFGCVTGIYVAANVNHNQIIGNDVGSSNVWGANTVSIQLAVGTSDYYWTLANRIFGSGAINNGATGSHFYIAGNM